MTIKQKKDKEVKQLAKVFNNDLDLVLFFLKWRELGQNATKAYMELHPGTDYATAGVLGSRMLKKVRIEDVLETYGVGLEKWLQQLKEGLEATKWNDFTGEREADHTTRKHYHDKQGKLLGIEKNDGINVSGEKVIAIMGGVTVKQDVQTSNSNDEVIEAE